LSVVPSAANSKFDEIITIKKNNCLIMHGDPVRDIFSFFISTCDI